MCKIKEKQKVAGNGILVKSGKENIKLFHSLIYCFTPRIPRYAKLLFDIPTPCCFIIVGFPIEESSCLFTKLVCLEEH